MARVIGIHEVELKPGVTEAEFEEAMQAWLAQPTQPGWRVSLFKGNRGDRSGKYGLVFEIDSIEARDRFTSDDGETEESKKFDANHPELVRTFDHAASLAVAQHSWTDYYEILSSK